VHSKDSSQPLPSHPAPTYPGHPASYLIESHPAPIPASHPEAIPAGHPAGHPPPSHSVIPASHPSASPLPSPHTITSPDTGPGPSDHVAQTSHHTPTAGSSLSIQTDTNCHLHPPHLLNTHNHSNKRNADFISNQRIHLCPVPCSDFFADHKHQKGMQASVYYASTPLANNISCSPPLEQPHTTSQPSSNPLVFTATSDTISDTATPTASYNNSKDTLTQSQMLKVPDSNLFVISQHAEIDNLVKSDVMEAHPI